MFGKMTPDMLGKFAASFLPMLGLTPETVAALVDEFRKKADDYVRARQSVDERLARLEQHFGIAQPNGESSDHD